MKDTLTVGYLAQVHCCSCWGTCCLFPINEKPFWPVISLLNNIWPLDISVKKRFWGFMHHLWYIKEGYAIECTLTSSALKIQMMASKISDGESGWRQMPLGPRYTTAPCPSSECDVTRESVLGTCFSRKVCKHFLISECRDGGYGRSILSLHISHSIQWFCCLWKKIFTRESRSCQIHTSWWFQIPEFTEIQLFVRLVWWAKIDESFSKNLWCIGHSDED